MEKYYFDTWLVNFRINNFMKTGIFDIYNTPESKEENAIPKYNQIEKILRDQKNIHVTDMLLKSLLADYKNINARFFLSIFMITTFPEMINYSDSEGDASNNDSVEYNLYTYAKSLISYLIKIYECKSIFFRRILTLRFQYLYTVTFTLFDEFKKRDRLGLIEGLIVSYSEVEKFQETLSEGNELDNVTLEHIEIEKNKIMSRLKQLNGIEIFHQIREKRNVIIEKINKSVKDNMEKAYWDSIKSNISKSPPDYLVLIPLLKQVIMYVDTTLEFNKKYVEEVAENIDLEFLTQKIESGDITKFDLHDIIEYIIDTFIELEPRVRSDENKKYKQDTLSKLMSNSESELPNFIIGFFKDIFSRFENLITESEEYKKMPLISDIINQKRA